ncbi:239_t:CDS:2, partial [Gigaspora margarita]
ESIEILDSNLSSINMNIKKAEHEFVSLLDNYFLLSLNPDLEVLLTNNLREVSVFNENKA